MTFVSKEELAAGSTPERIIDILIGKIMLLEACSIASLPSD